MDNDHKRLALAIAAILRNAQHYDWSLQGFGMLRLYLSPEVRLHVWSTEHAVDDVSAIHNHPWDFESVVLWGSIRDIIYEVESGPATHHEQRILCGPGGHAIGEKLDTRLLMRQDANYMAGQRYRMRAETLHESRPAHGTVTLITRTFRADPDHARVFFPLGTEWVSAEPRTATKEEVSEITSAALMRLRIDMPAEPR